MTFPDDYLVPGIKPYFIEDFGIIYNEKAEDILPKFKDKSIDLVLTDFPYANNTNYKNYKDTKENLKELIKSCMPELLRISKRCLITPGVGNLFLYPPSDWVLSWAVPAGTGSSCWGFSCWQPILAYGKDPYLANGLGRQSDLFLNKISKTTKKHPCPKPLEIWQWILQRGSAKETDVILDCFLGSGTTAVACKEAGRKYIGIEISEEYCELAKSRLTSMTMNINRLLQEEKPKRFNLGFNKKRNK